MNDKQAHELAAAMNAAVNLHSGGKLDDAAAAYRVVLRRFRDYPPALHLLGVTAFQRRDYVQAREFVERAIAVHPEFPQALCDLGSISAATGDLEQAVVSYRQALAIDPNYVEAHNNLGAALTDLGQYDAAIEALRQTLALKPDHVSAHFNLGNLLRERGDLDAAADSYRRAVSLKPDYVEAHSNLGNVLQRQGRSAEAIGCFHRALEIRPAYANGHFNLGNVLRDGGDMLGAVASYRRALEIDPNHVGAHSNLGLAHLALTRVEDAEASFRRALDLDPEFPEALNNLGQVLLHRDALDEAEALFDRTLAQRPDDAPAQTSKAEMLLMQGHFEEAAERFRAAIECDPVYAKAYTGLANTTTISAGDPVVAALEALLQQEGLSGSDKADVQFALAKCYNDMGDFDAAFAHCRAGNEFRKSVLPFDRDRFTGLVDRTVATYSEAFFAERSWRGSDSEKPVLVVGMPRSGTTLVEQILAAHPDVRGAGELTYLPNLAWGMAERFDLADAYPDCVSSLDETAAAELAQEYLDRAERQAGDAPRIVDKAPLNFHYLGLATLLFQNVRIVHCRRNPLDVGLSCYLQNFAQQPFSHDLADIALLYRGYHHVMAHWHAVLPVEILDVQYEELVADTESMSRRIVAHCGLPWDDACLSYQGNRRSIRTVSAWQARQPIYGTSVARWKRYETHLAPLVAALEEGSGS